MTVITTKCPETSCIHEAIPSCLSCYGEGEISTPEVPTRCKLTVDGSVYYVTDPDAAKTIARAHRAAGRMVRLQAVHS